jgi:hypothetical protein
MVWFKIPHFSGVNPTITGYAPASSSNNTIDDGSPGSGSGVTLTAFWTTTYAPSIQDVEKGYTRELYVKNRIKVKVNSQDHYVGIISLSSTQATINVSSNPQQAVFSIGDEKKFDVTNDGYYDVYIKLNGININGTKANLTIKTINEKVTVTPPPSNGTITPPPSNGTTITPTTSDGSGGNASILKKPWFWIVIILVIVGIAITITELYLRKRYYHKGY